MFESYDSSKVKEKIILFITNYMKKSGFSKLVLGLSGGLDSAVCAYLAVEAVGRKNLLLINMPYSISSPQSYDDAKRVAETLGIEMLLFPITKMVDALLSDRPTSDRLRIGNICARSRMIVLYDFASENNALVVSTGNKTERYLGYTTMWGDMAGAFAPLGDIYKSQERILARFLSVPDLIIDKTPTADLWENQSDEGEMGITYLIADQILFRLFELSQSDEEIIEAGFRKKDIELVKNMYSKNEFKRRLPEYPLL